MKLKYMFAVAGMLALINAPACMAASSDTFRCQNDLVRLGETKSTVSQKCGEPVFKDAFCKPADKAPTANNVNVSIAPCESVDEWTYNPGTGQFMTTLRFESGKLVSIKYGARAK